MSLLDELVQAIKTCRAHTGEDPKAWILHPVVKVFVIAELKTGVRRCEMLTRETLLGILVEWRHTGAHVSYRDRHGDTHIVRKRV